MHCVRNLSLSHCCLVLNLSLLSPDTWARERQRSPRMATPKKLTAWSENYTRVSVFSRWLWTAYGFDTLAAFFFNFIIIIIIIFCFCFTDPQTEFVNKTEQECWARIIRRTESTVNPSTKLFLQGKTGPTQTSAVANLK